MADYAIETEKTLEALKIRDWTNNLDVLNAMKNHIEDRLYEIEEKEDIRFSSDELDDIINQVIDIAKKRS